jgi:hypothetical protein
MVAAKSQKLVACLLAYMLLSLLFVVPIDSINCSLQGGNKTRMR